MSDLNKYGTAADVNKYIAELEAQLATALRERDLISQETIEMCAHEAEICDSEPLSGKSIAQQIRALSAADIRAKWERKTQDAERYQLFRTYWRRLVSRCNGEIVEKIWLMADNTIATNEESVDRATDAAIDAARVKK